MQKTNNFAQRALISGTVAGVATALVASMAGKRQNGSYAAPLNATSHILWGDQAALQNAATMKYTATGFLLNHAATTMWAAVYEKWFAGTNSGVRWPKPVAKPLMGAAMVAAGAYITDYHLIPRRFTPGFEKRVSGKALAIIFGALALGLAARGLASDNTA